MLYCIFRLNSFQNCLIDWHKITSQLFAEFFDEKHVPKCAFFMASPYPCALEVPSRPQGMPHSGIATTRVRTPYKTFYNNAGPHLLSLGFNWGYRHLWSHHYVTYDFINTIWHEARWNWLRNWRWQLTKSVQSVPL